MSGRAPVFDNIRIIPKEDAFLDRKLGSRGEIFFDQAAGTLRLYNGTTGGIGLLRDDLSNLKTSALNRNINVGSGTITASQFIGNLQGSLTGNVIGDLAGNTFGSHTGSVTGNLTGNVTGDLTGNVTGDLTGNVTGDLTGNVTGDLTGNVTGNVTGNLTGNVNGNSATATVLQTVRTINGVNFNGSSNITITAAAGTLTGNVLSNNVTASNLSSVGTLNNLTVNGNITTNSNVVIETIPTDSRHATNKKYVDSRAIAFGVAMS